MCRCTLCYGTSCSRISEELPARIRDRYGDYYDRAVPYLPLDRVELDRLRQFTSAVMAG